ncbi:MAG: C-terminal binding protein [Rhodospirillales bacterium]
MSSQAAPTVLVLEPGYADYAREREVLAPLGAGLLAVPADSDPLPLLRQERVVALLVRERRIDRALLESAPDLKAVVRYGVGVDNIDLEAARRLAIAVANVPDYGAEHEVSELAVALYLAVARRLLARDASLRAGRWGVAQAEPIPGRRGATLGLIGFGKIARQAAQKFRALGCGRILVSDPALRASAAEAAGVELSDLDRLCAEADILSLHAPLTEATRHILDRRRLALLRPSAIVINVSRGGLIDEMALAEALQKGRLFGAGLDVFEQEPPQAGHPLFTAPNVVLSDHAAWYSEATVAALQGKAAAEVARVLGGQPPVNWANPW